MCGFCGFTGFFTGADVVVKSMMDRIAHRGPDSEGSYTDENISLGFRRLSFLDLSESGSQPMYNKDRTLVIVFNGEIYNYKDLKTELEEKGYEFLSSGDTEVVINLYKCFGEDMLLKLRGMFSFIIYDLEKNEIFGARDFFGIKPFYYSKVNENLLFASEIKSFLEYPEFKKEVNTLALENYLTFQYSVLDETFFKGVYKLPPAHYLKFKNGNLEVTRYWEPKFEEVSMNLEQTVTSIDNTVLDSIEMHKVSDVEVGSFLSSGVDSSYVAACFNGDKTFTVGFDYDNYDETDYAKKLSEKIGVENISKTITTEEYWNALPKVQYHMDEPLADPAAIALYFVSEIASKHVKAAMSGEGADEFFGGYNIYKEPLDLKIITSLPMPIRKFLGKLASMIPFSIKGKNFFIRASKTIEERFIGNANIFSKTDRERILKKPSGNYSPQLLTKPFYDKVSDKDDITKMQYIDIHFWLIGDILLKADKMSMANSLEVRVPFLDRQVFKVASRIPTNFRVNKTDTKYAFRMAAKNHLPEEVANKKKLGFPIPIRIWLKEDIYFSKVKSAFESEPAKEFFNVEEIVKLLKNHKDGKVDNSRKIWTIYMFLVWYNEFFILN